MFLSSRQVGNSALGESDRHGQTAAATATTTTNNNNDDNDNNS